VAEDEVESGVSESPIGACNANRFLFLTQAVTTPKTEK
jgi:hypothetical protein